MQKVLFFSNLQVFSAQNGNFFSISVHKMENYFTFAPVMVFTFVEYQITLFPRNIPLEQFA